MLNFPIIIYGNSATANINTGPNITIADIGDERDAGLRAHRKRSVQLRYQIRVPESVQDHGVP